MTRPRKNPGASGIRTRDLLLPRRTRRWSVENIGDSLLLCTSLLIGVVLFPQTRLDIEITAHHDCVSQFVFHLLKKSQPTQAVLVEGYIICIDENQGFVSLISILYSNTPNSCELVRHLPKRREFWWHNTAVLPLNDCDHYEALKHWWRIWECPCFLQAHHITVIHHFSKTALRLPALAQFKEHIQ